MFVAINEAKERIFANKFLPKGIQYSCPVCGGEVRLRAGNINIAHFAHITSCTDDFTHDMSHWHRAWQELFPLKNREVIIEHNGEIHRADILCYGTVIEIQHSPISEDEFRKRNHFYTSAGYKVVWIFDLIDVVESERIWRAPIWPGQKNTGSKYRWNHPWRFLKNILPQNEQNIDIFFQMIPFGNNPKDIDTGYYMERIVWVDPDYKTLWGWFRTSNTISNYVDLLKWLKKRREQEQYQSPDKSPPYIATLPLTGHKYLSDGKIINTSELEVFLKKTNPTVLLKSVREIILKIPKVDCAQTLIKHPIFKKDIAYWDAIVA